MVSQKLFGHKKQLQGRIILHFGAVDYQAAVYVNGEIAENIRAVTFLFF